MIDARVTTAPLDLPAFHAKLLRPGVGGIATFTGVVRGDGGLVSLTLEHYPAMTARVLSGLAAAAAARWSLAAAVVHHRVGVLVPGEVIVLVGTAAAHRHAALEACAFLIDRLKVDAPFWKREGLADGTARWVEARSVDAAAAARWG